MLVFVAAKRRVDKARRFLVIGDLRAWRGYLSL